MNYKTTNRLLRRGGWRVFWVQLLWVLALGAIALPIVYRIGRGGQAAPGFAAAPLRRAGATSSAPAEPSPDAVLCLLPFGDAPIIEGGLVDAERRLWTSSYELGSAADAAHWLDELRARWLAIGVVAELTENGRIIGAAPDAGITLHATAIIDPRAARIEIHCWEAVDSSRVLNVEALMREFQIPPPSAGSAIGSWREGEGENGVLFHFEETGEAALVFRRVCEDLELLGWHTLSIDSGEQDAASDTEAVYAHDETVRGSAIAIVRVAQLEEETSSPVSRVFYLVHGEGNVVD